MLDLTFHLVSDTVSLKFTAIYARLPSLIAISHFPIGGQEIQKCTAASDCVGSGDLNLGLPACRQALYPPRYLSRPGKTFLILYVDESI